MATKNGEKTVFISFVFSITLFKQFIYTLNKIYDSEFEIIYNASMIIFVII